VAGKDSNKLCRREVYCRKHSYKFVGGVNRLKDDKIRSWFFQRWTSTGVKCARRESKTESTSELIAIQAMLAEY
jgi:hypothetical protein